MLLTLIQCQKILKGFDSNPLPSTKFQAADFQRFFCC